MMVRIFILDTFELRTLECVYEGQCFLADVIAGCDQQGRYTSLDMPDDADFGMSLVDYYWWEKWAEQEERINDALDGADSLTIEAHERLVGEWGHDLEELQAREMKLLGLD